MLYLTPAARPVLEQIHRLAAMVHDEACADLPQERREALLADLGRLKGNLSNKQCLEKQAVAALDVALLAGS